MEILDLEFGERIKLFQFEDEFTSKVEKNLATNKSWIVIPFEKQTLILDIQSSKIKYLEKANGKHDVDEALLVVSTFCSHFEEPMLDTYPY